MGNSFSKKKHSLARKSESTPNFNETSSKRKGATSSSTEEAFKIECGSYESAIVGGSVGRGGDSIQIKVDNVESPGDSVTIVDSRENETPTENANKRASTDSSSSRFVQKLNSLVRRKDASILPPLSTHNSARGRSYSDHHEIRETLRQLQQNSSELRSDASTSKELHLHSIKDNPHALVYKRVESIVREMQKSVDNGGLPFRHVNTLRFNRVDGVFTGQDLLTWLMRRFSVSTVEGSRLASRIASLGYFYYLDCLCANSCPTKAVNTFKGDSSFYRFQTPYYWPSKNGNPPENTDYAIYLYKRTLSKNYCSPLITLSRANTLETQLVISEENDTVETTKFYDRDVVDNVFIGGKSRREKSE